MPLALLLQKTFGTWNRDVTRLNDWNRLVDLEETLLQRARGVFMARWFGTGLPIFVGSLRVAIANIDELKERYRIIRAGVMRQNPDLNLTEPIAGIAGTMIGALLAPTSSMALMAVISQEMPNWITILAASLNWLTFGSLGVLLFAVAVPLAAAATPVAVIAKRDVLAAIHRFLGGLAGLFSAARRFLEQIIGRREDVKNPLLRQILGVLDRMAEVLPFLFALAALILVWVGPKLSPLAKQLDILIALAKTTFRIVSLTLTDLFERLQELYTGKDSPWAVLQGIIRIFRTWCRFIQDEFAELVKVAAPAFESVPVDPKKPEGKKQTRVAMAVTHALEDAFSKVLPYIKRFTVEHWLFKAFTEIGDRFGKIAAVFTTLKKKPPAPKKDPGWTEKRLKPILPALPADLSFPDLPKIPDLISPPGIFAREEWLAMLRQPEPDVYAWSGRDVPKIGYLFTLLPSDEEALKRLRRPPADIFAAEHKALLQGKPASDVLAEMQAKEVALRTMLFAIIDNLLPPAVADEVPMLQGRLWELDETLYGKKAQFPVRDLPGGDRLSVNAQKLRVHAPGMKESAVRHWSADLRTALTNQIYRTERPGAEAAAATK